jgi:hypothetical protein
MNISLCNLTQTIYIVCRDCPFYKDKLRYALSVNTVIALLLVA